MTFGSPITAEERGAGYRAALVRYLKQQAARQAADRAGAARAAALSELALTIEREPAGELLIGVIAAMHGATGSDIYAPGEHARRVLDAYGVEPLPRTGTLARQAVEGDLLAEWSRAAIKDTEENGLADAHKPIARRRAQPDRYDGPEVA